MDTYTHVMDNLQRAAAENISLLLWPGCRCDPMQRWVDGGEWSP